MLDLRFLLNVKSLLLYSSIVPVYFKITFAIPPATVIPHIRPACSATKKEDS